MYLANEGFFFFALREEPASSSILTFFEYCGAVHWSFLSAATCFSLSFKRSEPAPTAFSDNGYFPPLLRFFRGNVHLVPFSYFISPRNVEKTEICVDSSLSPFLLFLSPLDVPRTEFPPPPLAFPFS